jgi:hypothetical protein
MSQTLGIGRPLVADGIVFRHVDAGRRQAGQVRLTQGAEDFFYGLGRLVPRGRPILSEIARDFGACLRGAS